MAASNVEDLWKEIEDRAAAHQTDVLAKIVPPDFPFENNGNEWRVPPFLDALQLCNVIPTLIYFAFFRFVAAYVKKNLWQSRKGFRQYRLHNISVCLLHSIISGIIAFTFAVFEAYAMFVQPMHWYRSWARHGLLFSIGYFMHDSIDMVSYELSRWTMELLVHHATSVFAFVTTISSHKFVPFAYCSLLMEVNSIFLHTRTLMQLSKGCDTYPQVYGVIRGFNVSTFVFFRLLVQIWQFLWVHRHAHQMHLFYRIFGYFGGVAFFLINLCLFSRVIASDGWLGECGRKRIKNRDEVQSPPDAPEEKKNA